MRIYYMNIEEIPDHAIEDYVHVLAPLRREKMMRMKQSADKKRSFGVSVLLIYAYFDFQKRKLPENEWKHIQESNVSYMQRPELKPIPELSETPEGKPFFQGENEPVFSLSHSGSYVVCGIADRSRSGTGAVGVDVQNLQEFSGHFIERFFSEQERLLVCQRENRSHICTEIWSKKESLGKSRGIGLRGNLTELDTETCQEYLAVHSIPDQESYVLTSCTPEIQSVTLHRVMWMQMMECLEQYGYVIH